MKKDEYLAIKNFSPFLFAYYTKFKIKTHIGVCRGGTQQELAC